MSGRIGMNQVKIRVRATILALNQFTVDDLVRSTGLNSSSVHSELHRLKHEGLVEVVADPDGKKPRVGVPKRYKVVTEPDALRRLSESIESFRVPADPTSLEHPVSAEFTTLQQTLDQALIATPEQRVDLLRDGERLYQAAVEAEIATVAPESVQTYLRFERARLSYLTGDYDRAERIFRALQPVLTRLGDRQTAALADDYCLALTYQRESQRVVNPTAVVAAEALIDNVQQSPRLSGNPIAVLLRETLQKTVTRLRELERVVTAATMQTRERIPKDVTQWAKPQPSLSLNVVPTSWSVAHCKAFNMPSFQHVAHFQQPSEYGVLRAEVMAAIAELQLHRPSAVEALNAAVASIGDGDDRGLISVIHHTGHGFTPDLTPDQPPGAGILMVDDNGSAERAMVVISPEQLRQSTVSTGQVISSPRSEEQISVIRQAALSQLSDVIRASGLPEVSLGEDASVEVVVSAPFAERWQP